MNEGNRLIDDNHIGEDRMRQYVLGELAANERDVAEQHLAECEQCLQQFMAALESDTAFVPVEEAVIGRMEHNVIAQLVLEQPTKAIAPAARAVIQEKRASRSWVQHPVAQYVIAASITLLLLSSGSLGAITNTLAKIDQQAALQQSENQSHIEETDVMQPSWSDRMISRTGSWLDRLQASRFK